MKQLSHSRQANTKQKNLTALEAMRLCLASNRKTKIKY